MTAVSPPPPPSSPRPVPQPPRLVIERFRQTTPWARIVSIFNLAWCGLIALVLFILIPAALLGYVPIMVGIAAIVGEIGVMVSAIPGIILFRYCRGMQDAIKRPTVATVETALLRHKTFWIASAVLTLLVLIWDGISIFATVVIPNYRNAVSRSMLRRSVADVRALGDAVEHYARDHHRYPQAKDIEGLRRYLEPRYIAKVPSSDAWGVPFDYKTRCAGDWCYDFAVISRGPDGLRVAITFEDQLFGNSPFREKAVSVLGPGMDPRKAKLPGEEPPDRSIIYGDGRLLWAPVGMEKK